ncbi:MAG: methyltetrahydrofolate cobalamin methyltransferase [Thermincola sp.]|nr:methyltetrahydrofolate cobalamin methyltransferase [Thermincola sp.]MDT3701517.1 methyltetrahydrofolate cobalamin methyltransferase [Thermincola sp.]
MISNLSTLLIGEKINTSRREIREAVETRNAVFIREIARKQAEAGAHYLDVNCGTFKNEEEIMTWLVEEIQDEVDVPLCIDSPYASVIEAGLKANKKGKPMINSISGEEARYEAFIELCKKYDSKIVVLCMDDKAGIPRDAEIRLQIASRVINGLEEAGVGRDDIYVDPLVQPISTSTANGLAALEVMEKIKQMYPGIHITCGLSNVSYGLPKRQILNQIFTVLCMKAGLDSLILDPLDKRLMSLIIVAEALLDKDPYCFRYLKAFRQSMFD